MTDRDLPRGRIKFLVCVDGSDDSRVALRFASMRAQNTGGFLALVYVIEPTGFRHWGNVETLMRDEAVQEADDVLDGLAGEVFDEFGVRPELHVREGDRAEEILAVIENDPTVHIVVVGAAPEGREANPLMTQLVGQLTRRLRIPLTMVPGNLTDDQLRGIT